MFTINSLPYSDWKVAILFYARPRKRYSKYFVESYDRLNVSSVSRSLLEQMIDPGEDDFTFSLVRKGYNRCSRLTLLILLVKQQESSSMGREDSLSGTKTPCLQRSLAAAHICHQLLSVLSERKCLVFSVNPFSLMFHEIRLVFYGQSRYFIPYMELPFRLKVFPSNNSKSSLAHFI